MKSKINSSVLILFVLSFMLTSCYEKSPKKETPKEVRWVTESVEYIGICKQTYAMAWDRVRSTAESTNGPWAVVLDVDETVLNNAQYEIELHQKGETFSSQSWTAWVERRDATAIPGVKQFLDNVRSLGENAFVVFITNRDAHHEKATIDNLIKEQLWHDGDVILCRKEKSDTKQIRRNEIIEASGRCAGLPKKQIIALFGDNLKDFYEVDGTAGLTKIKDAAMQDSRWGTKFFVLPNPMYGSWVDAYK
ncbi:MAG: hypothetical protein DWQ05_09340 [Calditrichaeota bacterium]|nr:MAG: hypothetical protein DWQ05_09340 [Calditrichota bacterium]